VLRALNGSPYPAEFLAVVQALEMVPQPASCTDRDGRILYVNPAFLRLYQFLPEDALGRNPRLLVPRPLPLPHSSRTLKSL
jgi:PAS domain S-box-containing protein